jgi:hypothetical protein
VLRAKAASASSGRQRHYLYHVSLTFQQSGQEDQDCGAALHCRWSKILWMPSVIFGRLFRKWEQDKIFMQDSYDHMKQALPQVQEEVLIGGQKSTHKLQTGQRKPLVTLWERKVRTTSVTSRTSCNQRTVLLLEEVPESISSSLRVADLKVETNV